MKSKILKFLTLAAALCGATAWGDPIATQEAFVTACADAVSGDTLELGNGEFAIGPVDINGKTLTFKGQGAANTKVYIGNGGYDGNGGHGSSKTANMTFEDVTLDDLASNSGYLTGFTEAAGLTFRNVTFNVGFSNWGNKGGDVSFYNCTFNQAQSDKYCVQELRSANGTKFLFDGCTFNCTGEGRFINAYKQGGAGTAISIVVKDCTFDNSEGSAKYGALYLKDDYSDGCNVNLTFVGTNTAKGEFPTTDTGSALCATKAKGHATISIQDSLESEPRVIYQNNATTTDWVDPNGYTPHSAAPTLKPSTVDGFYHITSLDDLKLFRDLVNADRTSFKDATVVLDVDIDLGNEEWTPIKTSYLTFDGNDKTISNLKVTSEAKNVGLFGEASISTIKNLTINGANVSGINHVAAIAGDGLCAKIENCHVKNAVITTVVKDNDDGDKAGAIVGYLSAESTAWVKNCTVDNCTITGAGSVGGLVGHANGNVNGVVTVDGCTISGNTITSTGSSTEKAGSVCGTVGNAPINVSATVSDNTVTSGGTAVTTVYGRKGSANGALTLTGGVYDAEPISAGDSAWAKPIAGYEVVQNASGAYILDEVRIAQIGSTKYATIAEAVAAAQAGDTVEVLVAGTYTLPNLPKNITIKGTVEGVAFNCQGSGSIASVPNGATFENVTFTLGNTNYHGFQHAGTINMNECTVNGLLFSYGDMNFTECTFKQTENNYCMWCYGKDVTYTDCTFDTAGKALNVYCENNSTAYNIVVDGCTFKSSTLRKAAVNIKETCGANMLNYNVTVKDNCTMDGAWPEATEFDPANKLWVISPLVQVDDRNTSIYPSESGITVTKGSDLVYPMVTMLQLPVTADDGTKLLLTVPDTFFTDMVTYPAGATAAQKAEAQSAHLDDATVDANGLKVWQNYAMGVDGSSAGNTLTTDYAVGAGEWITVKTPISAFNPPADSGITVTYRLLRTTTPEDAASWEAFGEPLDTPAFPVDLSTQTGDTFWKIEAVFTGEAVNE